MKKKKKTFREMYLEEKSKPTAAAQFVAETAKALEVTENTVRQWLTGEQVPHKARKDKIQAYFGQSIESLFPNANYDEK